MPRIRKTCYSFSKPFLPECHKSHFYTLTSNPFLNLNTISSLDFTITSCTRLLQIPASNSQVKPSCFSKVRMNPLNNSLLAFFLSICSAISSYLAFAFSYLLFVTLPASNYPKILQIKRRYSLKYSDVFYVRLF